jgi:multidrug efflux pump subunit AcrB
VKITEYAIRSPLVVTGLGVALCIFGLFASLRLGVAVSPEVDVPSVIATTVYPGADSETAATNVTKPLDDAIATLPNIEKKSFRSTSAAGRRAAARG